MDERIVNPTLTDPWGGQGFCTVIFRVARVFAIERSRAEKRSAFRRTGYFKRAPQQSILHSLRTPNQTDRFLH